MFRLSLKDNKKKYLDGTIIINDFKESFTASSTFYKEHDYYKSWKRTIELLLKRKKSYFLVNVGNPDNSNWYSSWSVYLVNEYVYLQNMMFFSEKFNLNDVLMFNIELSELFFRNEYGDTISTWKTKLEYLLSYYEELNELLK